MWNCQDCEAANYYCSPECMQQTEIANALNSSSGNYAFEALTAATEGRMLVAFALAAKVGMCVLQSVKDDTFMIAPQNYNSGWLNAVHRFIQSPNEAITIDMIGCRVVHCWHNAYEIVPKSMQNPQCGDCGSIME